MSLVDYWTECYSVTDSECLIPSHPTAAIELETGLNNRSCQGVALHKLISRW